MSDLMKTTYDKYVLQLYHLADHLSLLVKRFTQFLKVKEILKNIKKTLHTNLKLDLPIKSTGY